MMLFANNPDLRASHATSGYMKPVTKPIRGRDMARKSPSSAQARRKIHRVMREYKLGRLNSGSGDRVKSRKQAIAIALSEGRDIEKKHG